MAEKVQDKKQKHPAGKGSEEQRGQKPGDKSGHADNTKKGTDNKKKW